MALNTDWHSVFPSARDPFLTITKEKQPKSSEFHFQNQLQFNLNVPTDPKNLAFRYQRPGPLIIEKIKKETKQKEDRNSDTGSSALKLSTASEEKLSWAVQLARRDLKNMLQQQKLEQKKREEEELAAPKLSKKKKTIKGSKGKTAANYRSRMSAVTAPKPKQNITQNLYMKSVRTQTPPTKMVFYSNKGILGSHESPQVKGRWTSSHSPEKAPIQVTKVHGSSPSGKLSPDSQQAREIRRLRKEIRFYVDRIEHLTKEAQGSSKLESFSDDEGVRKETRRQEQASRSARLLYSLLQQVRDLQKDLKQGGPSYVRHTKKSRALTRLAAAHRGAVRTIQTLINQLPDQLDESGMLPPVYRDLGELMQQLAACCIDLDVDDAGVPDSIMNILQQAKRFEQHIIQQDRSPLQGVGHTPIGRNQTEWVKEVKPTNAVSPKRTVAPKMYQKSPNTSTRRKLHFQGDKEQDQTKLGLVGNHQPTLDSKVSPGPASVQRLRKQVTDRGATPGSPERTSAIQAGLDALMRMGERNVRTEKPTQPKLQVKGQRKGHSRTKSVILPSKLKHDRERIQKMSQLPKETNFLKPTFAFQLKQREAQKKLEEVKVNPGQPPAWTPPGTPRSFHQSPQKTPTKDERSKYQMENDDVEVVKKDGVARKVQFDIDEDKGGMNAWRGMDREVVEREIARQAWLDVETSRKIRELDKVREDMGAQDHRRVNAWIDEAEKAVQERLQPLIDQAQAIADDHNKTIQTTKQSLRHNLSERTSKTVSDHAGVLSELIMEDVLEDTAKELSRIHQEEEIKDKARILREKPTLESLLQSLEAMENEEEEIRRRWRSIWYKTFQPDDEVHKNLLNEHGRAEWMMGTPLEGEVLERTAAVPRQHTGIYFSNQQTRQHPSLTIVKPSDDAEMTYSSEYSYSQLSDAHAPDETSLSSKKADLERQSRLKRETWHVPEKDSFSIFVPQDMIDRTNVYRRHFDDHLKRVSHYSYGTFNPWKLIEEVSDTLLDGVLNDVAEEFNDIGSQYLDTLYKAEFEQVPGTTAGQIGNGDSKR